jgi:hypothetical protein
VYANSFQRQVVLGIQGYTIIYVSEAMLLPITIQLPPIAGKENFDCIHPYKWIMYWGCMTYTTDHYESLCLRQFGTNDKR